MPNCGDGVVDEGEECDDGNRLNGDSCDWLCQLGEGEPPPEPDPAAEEYIPSGDPVPAGDAIVPFIMQCRIPLSWSGTQFATAYPSDDDIRFQRFDADGRRLDSDWTSPVVSHDVMPTAELIWNGDGYGLFYVDGSLGLFFLRLDVEGKPIGEPVLVVDEPDVLSPAADLTPEGYVLVWSHCEHFEGSVNLLFVGPNGTTEGLPEPLLLADTMDEACGEMPDVASGPSGYAVSMGGFDDDVRIVWVKDDLSEVRSSGILSTGRVGEIKWAGDSYVTAWNEIDFVASPAAYRGTCVARFSARGVLESPPVCSSIGAEAGVSLAAGDNELALVFRSGLSDHNLSFVNTDRFGVPIGHRYDFTDDEAPEFLTVLGTGTTWADDGFAVIFSVVDRLMLQRFVADY